MENNSQDARTIWCGNLSERVTEELLYELFLQAGPLERVSIPKDRDGRPRTFGFVTYVHQISVPYAINLFNGTCLFDRTLSMKNRIVQQPQQPQNNKKSPHHHRNNQNNKNESKSKQSESIKQNNHTKRNNRNSSPMYNKHPSPAHNNGMLPNPKKSLASAICVPNQLGIDALLQLGSQMYFGSGSCLKPYPLYPAMGSHDNSSHNGSSRERRYDQGSRRNNHSNDRRRNSKH